MAPRIVEFKALTTGWISYSEGLLAARAVNDAFSPSHIAWTSLSSPR